jgi:NTP pyrophosphatase (non-canonical NTP hydrolase)|tara:strand:- start:285 stop:563 length:279 start_codon:yes stop_codon:yes gene_type:complete
MNKLETNLLYILGEECSEVVQAISKANRFGFDTKFESDITNAEKISYEMADLVAVYEMLVEHNIVPKYDDKLKQLKKDKVINLFKEFTKEKK